MKTLFRPLWLGVSLTALLIVVSSISANNQASRTIQVVNDSGRTIQVDWVHPLTGKATTIHKGVGNGHSTTLNSFVNHTLALHERADDCQEASNNAGSCGVQYITVSEKRKQVATIKRGLKVDIVDAKSNVDKSFGADCKQRAYADMASGKDPQQVMDALKVCLQDKATTAFQRKNEEIAFEEILRLEMSGKVENYTCADPNRKLTKPQQVRRWQHNNVTRNVLIMHDRKASQIHVLEDFISAEECDAITTAAEPILHRGTVANGKGGHRLSESRKAWQAGIRVPWEMESQGDPIARVVRRLFDYTNDAVGFNLTVEGQEDLMSIQYFGIGNNSSEAPDQYRPHCDGACDGLPHKIGGRVATMVMYCDVPELGGATNFQNSNVFVKPKLHAAAFFSYYDIGSGFMETGFTSHSGCPVIEGTKRIAVQWMRIGVDKETPWDSFNTLTIKKSEEED